MNDVPWKVVEQLFGDANEVLLAAPYIKAETLSQIISRLRVKAALTCVTRWTPTDIALRVSDVECRAMVLEHGGEFRLHPRLHAKYYRFDDIVLVGSANISNPGLSLFSRGNLEILCRPGADFDGQAFEGRLLVESHCPTEVEFAKWSMIAEMPSSMSWPNVPPMAIGSSDWRPMTRDPLNLWRVYSGRVEQVASEEERRAALEDIARLGIPAALGEEEFEVWVAGLLLSSSFVDAVVRLGDQELRSAWSVISQTWGIRISDASRDMETTQNWLRHFLSEL